MDLLRYLTAPPSSHSPGKIVFDLSEDDLQSLSMSTQGYLPSDIEAVVKLAKVNAFVKNQGNDY